MVYVEYFIIYKKCKLIVKILFGDVKIIMKINMILY